MAGLLDYNVDPIAQGLLGFSQGMLTPRAQGGGVGAALGGFNQNAMAAQNAIYERQRQQQQDALKTRLTNAQIGEFDSQAAERTAKIAETQRKLQVMQQTRAQIAKSNPDMLAYFDADPINALKRIYPEMRFETLTTPDGGSQQAWVAPGQAPQPVGAPVGPKMEFVEGTAVNPRAIPQGTQIPKQMPWEYENGPNGPQMRPGVLGAKTAIAGAGAAKNLNLVNAYEPASVAAQKEFISGMGKNYDALSGAGPAIANIEKAKALVPQVGGFAGSFGDRKLEVAKFFNNNLGTNIDPKGVASAEELRSRLFIQIMDNLKKMDAQPSQMQQQIMQDALGKLTTDPAAIPRVLDVFKEIVTEKVNVHNQKAEQAIKNGVVFPFDPRIQIPQTPAQQPAAPTQGAGRVLRFDKNGNPVR